MNFMDWLKTFSPAVAAGSALSGGGPPPMGLLGGMMGGGGMGGALGGGLLGAMNPGKQVGATPQPSGHQSPGLQSLLQLLGGLGG
jgi:hypothetical protein